VAHSTQLSVSMIEQQAGRHDQTADSINKVLDNLKQDVETVLSRSKNGATSALNTVCDHWVESVRKSVIAHLQNMAENIRRESKNQNATDEEAAQALLKLPMDTGNFLGV
jgi:uncharacterized protein YukE